MRYRHIFRPRAETSARPGGPTDAKGCVARAAQSTYLCARTQVFVEAAENIAVQGSVKVCADQWEQLKQLRHRRCVRALVSSTSLTTWRRLLARNYDTARLLAKCLIRLPALNGPRPHTADDPADDNDDN